MVGHSGGSVPIYSSLQKFYTFDVNKSIHSTIDRTFWGSVPVFLPDVCKVLVCKLRRDGRGPTS